MVYTFSKQSFFYLILCILIPVIIYPQVNYNQRDDKYRLLGLKRAKELYETARKEYERAKDLYSKKYISEDEFDKIKASYSDAEVNYQQSLLAVLFENQFVSVDKAVKYQTKDGKKYVRLRVSNSSGGGEEFQKLLNIDDKLFRSLQPDVINNVYLSISNNDGAIISQPYEAKITQLKYGYPVDLNFNLLQDLDIVTVNIIYGNGSTRSMKIYLQKDASQNIVALQSQQFSQEIELGKTATYDLTLELFSRDNNTFRLEVVNLPTQINRYFKDAASDARLNQFKFTENTNTRKAVVEVSMPDRPSEVIKMDIPIQFFVLVIPADKNIPDLQKKNWTQKEIESLNIGFVKLELLPRGKGILLVRAPQLFYSINKSEAALVNFDLVNEGTRRLDNVEVKLDLPLNWTKQINPAIIKQLDISDEKQINLKIFPAKDISAGRYEIRIRTTSLSDNEPVTGEDKTLTIEIQSEANILGTIIIVLLILGLVGGIIFFGIKISKK
jgi:uncharacterized membrane protein